MNGKPVVAVLLAFAATTAFADPGGRSGGGRSGGGRPSGGHVSGARPSAGHVSGGYVTAGRAVRAHGVGTGAQYRHPVPGTGHGYYGHGYNARGYYPYYGRYPSSRRAYPYNGYYPYGAYWWPGFSVGLGFSWGGGYAYAGPGYRPYSGAYPVYGSDTVASPYAADPPPAGEDPPAVRRYAQRGEASDPARGELRLAVRPDDASVYVDDRFMGAARQLETLSLEPGPHRIEVVRPGFRMVERTVQVGPDEPATVVVDLDRR